jgi:uncharacterized protein (DUF58 family)
VKLIQSLYFSSRFFSLACATVALFVFSYFIPWMLPFSKGVFLLITATLAADFLILFSLHEAATGYRQAPERLSNGDENEIKIVVHNGLRTSLSVLVIDEIPHQFQIRNLNFRISLSPGETRELRYALRPVRRGEYEFGDVRVFIQSPLKLVSRKITFDQKKTVPVYPSFMQMRKYELLAISSHLVQPGIKRIRRIGHNLEFEQIKKYVAGDDARTVNWKATARKTEIMVNNFQDERSQQVYSLIDKGRVMQMPFMGMSLLDYAINASLAISNIAMKKSDKAGIITFQDKIGTVLPASRINRQLWTILQTLYNQKTAYRESDFSVLYSSVRRHITQRSLLLLFTNFETVYGLQRQLQFIKNLASHHLLVVIFFENTEMKTLVSEPARDLSSVYYKSVAEKFSYEKKLIVKELQKNGIQAVLTAPENLTVNTINKYLELKARNLI